MPQTTYSNDLTVALAGQIADNSDCEIVSFACAEPIPPGRQCVLNSSNLLELPQGTSFAKPVGVSCYLSAAPPGVYATGSMVPCVRRGRVVAEITGATPGQLVAANVNHSSTVATDRGKFTTTATSTSAGSEISDPGPAAFFAPSATGLAIVELNYPGAGELDDSTRLTALEANKVQTLTLTATAADVAAPDTNGTAFEASGVLPAGAVVLGYDIITATQFSGGSVSSLTLKVGATDDDAIVTAYDALAATAGHAQASGATPAGYYGGATINAFWTPDGGHKFSALTAGSQSVKVYYFVPA